MTRNFNSLSPDEQHEIELAYHQMSPASFEKQMKQATRQSPEVLRLPSDLIESLKKRAQSSGEPAYQDMVRRWIEERLQQETAVI
jgi:predicted DNA binding CopG/RHH family protein